MRLLCAKGYASSGRLGGRESLLRRMVGSSETTAFVTHDITTLSIFRRLCRDLGDAQGGS